MGIFTGAFMLGSATKLTEEDADAFMSEFEKIIADIDAWGIFTHNTVIALPMFVPGLGVAWGAFSAWSTGTAFAAITISNPGLGGINPLAILFSTPFGLMEVTAYSIGMSRSFILIRSIVKKTGLGRHAAPTLAEIGVVLLLLLAGGYVEFYLITAAGS
ncbi:MAG: stage II sporulation protein M [Nitrosopumilus sp. H8]|nr:MAG: stage II sporulation protein M [Nitrosopumilus sp. H13]RNJ79867.1 MAG: stage II sporulation protein M [Nitrosopumilus sp. H8]